MFGFPMTMHWLHLHDIKNTEKCLKSKVMVCKCVSKEVNLWFDEGNCVLLFYRQRVAVYHSFAQLEHRLHKGVFQTIIRKKNLHCVNLLPLQILK